MMAVSSRFSPILTSFRLSPHMSFRSPQSPSPFPVRSLTRLPHWRLPLLANLRKEKTKKTTTKNRSFDNGGYLLKTSVFPISFSLRRNRKKSQEKNQAMSFPWRLGFRVTIALEAEDSSRSICVQGTVSSVFRYDGDTWQGHGIFFRVFGKPFLALVFTEARVIIDRETGMSRGFGFVTFVDSESADSAVSAMDGQELNGRNIRVNIATDRPAGPRFGGGGGGGYGGGGGGGGY